MQTGKKLSKLHGNLKKMYEKVQLDFVFKVWKE